MEGAVTYNIKYIPSESSAEDLIFTQIFILDFAPVIWETGLQINLITCDLKILLIRNVLIKNYLCFKK